MVSEEKRQGEEEVTTDERETGDKRHVNERVREGGREGEREGWKRIEGGGVALGDGKKNGRGVYVCVQIDTECTQLSFQYSVCVHSCALSYVCGCSHNST